MTTFSFPKPGNNSEFDWDFQGMCEYTDPPYKLKDVSNVDTLVVGEKDKSEWVWLVTLKDGRRFKTTGGCDYTGWDCQAGSVSEELF